MISLLSFSFREYIDQYTNLKLPLKTESDTYDAIT